MRILLAEDDPIIADMIRTNLARDGYMVQWCDNGPDTWEQGDVGDFDAAILDLGLPGLDGLTLLKRWRSEGNILPVIVLTARGSWMERVDGFDAGADDYLPKPFRTEELLARLRALLRRATPVALPVIRAGRFVIDESRQTASFDGTPLELTPMEYRAIRHLAHNSGVAVSAADLAVHVQGREDDGARNAVEALVARLRRKTAPDAIETKRGFGYRIGTTSS